MFKIGQDIPGKVLVYVKKYFHPNFRDVSVQFLTFPTFDCNVHRNVLTLTFVSNDATVVYTLL